jgi:hypothetical protein
MGMYDESWCSSCGTSLPYSEDDVECGECVTEGILSFVKMRIKELTEYRDTEIAIGEYGIQDYTEGCIDTYDTIRIKLEG